MKGINWPGILINDQWKSKVLQRSEWLQGTALTVIAKVTRPWRRHWLQCISWREDIGQGLGHIVHQKCYKDLNDCKGQHWQWLQRWPTHLQGHTDSAPIESDKLIRGLVKSVIKGVTKIQMIARDRIDSDCEGDPCTHRNIHCRASI